jgi:prophage regulatory protein
MYQSKKEHNQRIEENVKIRKLIRIKTVANLTSLSKSYIYELCKKGAFPSSIQLVPQGNSVAWVESEVEGWIEERIAERDQEAT